MIYAVFMVLGAVVVGAFAGLVLAAILAAFVCLAPHPSGNNMADWSEAFAHMSPTILLGAIVVPAVMLIGISSPWSFVIIIGAGAVVIFQTGVAYGRQSPF